jgi:hypothetical protein
MRLKDARSIIEVVQFGAAERGSAAQFGSYSHSG